MSQSFEFCDPILDDFGKAFDLLFRITGGAESITDLAGRKAAQQPAHPAGIFARNASADPFHFKTLDEIRRRQSAIDLWTRRNREAHELRVRRFDKPGAAVGVEVSFPPGLRPRNSG